MHIVVRLQERLFSVFKCCERPKKVGAMAKFRFLLDNDVRHLEAVLPAKQAVHLEEVGLNAAATDREIVQVASTQNVLIVTNNRRDFQQAVRSRISESNEEGRWLHASFHGLVIVKPSGSNQSVEGIDRCFQEARIPGQAHRLEDSI